MRAPRPGANGPLSFFLFFWILGAEVEDDGSRSGSNGNGNGGAGDDHAVVVGGRRNGNGNGAQADEGPPQRDEGMEISDG